MENVYVLMAYVAVLMTLVGCVVAKVSDIFEKKRDEKYYRMIRDDAAFWQMKVEQTGINLTDMLMDRSIEKMKTEIQDAFNMESDEPKEVE